MDLSRCAYEYVGIVNISMRVVLVGVSYGVRWSCGSKGRVVALGLGRILSFDSTFKSSEMSSWLLGLHYG